MPGLDSDGVELVERVRRAFPDVELGRFVWMRAKTYRSPPDEWAPVPEDVVPQELRSLETISFLQREGPSQCVSVPGDGFFYRLVQIDEPAGPAA